MAEAYMRRLDAVMQGVNYASAAGDLKGFYSGLVILYAEIHPKLVENKDLLGSVDGAKEHMDEAYNSWVEIKLGGGGSGKRNRPILQQYEAELLTQCNKFNIRLRDAIHACKLLLPEALNPADAIFDSY